MDSALVGRQISGVSPILIIYCRLSGSYLKAMEAIICFGFGLAKTNQSTMGQMRLSNDEYFGATCLVLLQFEQRLICLLQGISLDLWFDGNLGGDE